MLEGVQEITNFISLVDKKVENVIIVLTPLNSFTATGDYYRLLQTA